MLGAALLLAAGGSLAWRGRARALKRRRHFNPYIAGAPVLDDNLFFGREQLVDRILQTVHNNSLLLHGERRIGKTSLQHHLKKRLQGVSDSEYEFHPVLIDLQGFRKTASFRTLAEDIFQELGPLLGGLELSDVGAGAQYGYRDLVRDLRAILRTLAQRSSKRIKLVLLIDEVDELNDYDPRINQRHCAACS